MNRKIFLAYDYYILKDGTVQYGVTDILVEFLKKNKIQYKTHAIEINPSLKSLLNKFKILSNDIKNSEIDIFIGYNFINAFYGIINRFIYRKKFKVIFVAVDFSKQRFKNFILNQIYIFMDYFVSKISDETWNCSSRVFEYRSNFLEKNKNYYLPNIPNYPIENLEKFENFTIVMISFLNENYQFEEVYDLFSYLQKNDIKMLIIGDGDRKDEIQNEIDKRVLSEKVKLTGYLNHLEIRKILERSHLGLALYGGKESYNFWGDSMKIREYTYYELPCITTKNVNNYKEVLNKSIGVCLEDFSSLTEAIKYFYENKNNFKEVVNNCKKYNLEFQMDRLFKERLFK